MRENIIKTVYSLDNKYRFEIADRKDGTYQVFVEYFSDDCCMGYMWSGWSGFHDHIHIVDTVERAMKIGNEALINLTGN